MRNLQTTSKALVLLLAGLAACGDSSPSGDIASVQMALAANASGAGVARIRATDSQSRVILERVFTLGADGSMAARFGLPPASYILRLELFPDQTQAPLLAAGSVPVDIKDGVITAIRARLDAAEKSADGVVKVALATDHAPVIEAVDVVFDPPLKLGLANSRNAHIHVTASDIDGDGLRFLWSGLGLAGVVEGGADLTVEAAKAELGPPIVFIVVEDGAGAAAIAKVAFLPVHDCLLCGDFRVMILGEAQRDPAATACLDTHSGCQAGCLTAAPTAQPHAACGGECGMALSACLTK
jgi:hypothetical protein